MKLIALTEKGQGLVEKSMKNRHAWLSELSNVLSDSEKEELLPAIKLLNQRTRELNIDRDRFCQNDSEE